MKATIRQLRGRLRWLLIGSSRWSLTPSMTKEIPTHIKTALVGSSQTLWIGNGGLLLGRWQAIFFAEFDGPRTREIHIKIVPDRA
jgi:secondary thiamine-phosphate synthase enzyme